MNSYDPLSNAVLDWVIRAIGPGAAISSVQLMDGATSSTLYAIECRWHGQVINLVLRLFTNQEWLAEEPDLAAHEASNLKKVKTAGLPTPELIAYDPSGQDCGPPAVLMTRLPGSVDLKPADFQAWLTQMAEILLPLHAVEASDYPWQYAPYFNVLSLQPPGWSRVPGLWQKAIEIASGPWPPYQERFIHRDYYPVNVLWQDQRLSGVVDWANACRGPAGIDVAWCRKDLAGMYGVPAADQFLEVYQRLAGSASAYHPFWDVLSILDGLSDPPSVYPPWITFGLQGLTSAILLEREEAYLASILARF